jgi:predicted acyl esterase
MGYGRLLRAEIVWFIQSIVSKARKYLLMPRQSVRVRGETPRVPIRIVKDNPVTMRDGVRLCTDVYLPRASGRTGTASEPVWRHLHRQLHS